MKAGEIATFKVNFKLDLDIPTNGAIMVEWSSSDGGVLVMDTVERGFT
jgi:hypothetical protein